MKREEKQSLISEMNGVFKDSELVIVAHYRGLTVAEMTDLRGIVRKAGAGFRVTKNRLTRLALAGTQNDKLESMFKGPTAVAYSKDPIAAAKAIVEYAKKNEKLVLVGGVMNGQQLDVNAVKALASLPSLPELRAKLLGLLVAPATRIAGVVQAPAGNVARVIGAHSRKDKAA